MIKKIFITMSFIFFMLLLGTSVQAAALTISTSKSTVTPGESFKVTITVKNGAGYVRAGVSNGTGGFGDTWLDKESTSFDCKAGSSGTVTIKASGTVADFATEKDENLSKSKTVTIQAKKTSTTTKKSTSNQTQTTKKTETKKVEEPKKEETKKEEEPPQQEKYLLQSLTIEGEELLPEFNSEVYEYTVKVADKEQLNISAKANQDNLIVDIVGNENLQYGENTVTISVKGQDDKEVTTYKLTIMKEKSELTLANERIQELEQLNNTLKTVIIALIILVILICIVSALKIRKYKNGRN